LRTLQREPEALQLVLAEIAPVAKERREIAGMLSRIEGLLRGTDHETRAREIVQCFALALQAALLVRHGPPAIADAFCRTRLGDAPPAIYGTLPVDIATADIVARAQPFG
jgi:putative acyl-CoA dehydrogenase